MSAYNRLHIDYSTQPSEPAKKYILQFKFGHSRLIDYRLGDKLAWGGNDNGEPGKKKVIVEGIEEGSSQTGQLKYWYIFLENDVIVGAEPDDGRYEFTNPDDYGIVLED
jgi:hypothetical protein